MSASPLFLFLALLPNLALLSKLVPLGMLAAALTAVVAIWRSLKDAAAWQSWDERIHNAWPLEPMALGSAVSISLGAFSISVVVPALVGDMRKPEHFPRALLGAILSCGGLYLGVMLCHGARRVGKKDLKRLKSIKIDSFLGLKVDTTAMATSSPTTWSSP